MPIAHTWRFASKGLLERRPYGLDTNRSRPRQDAPRPVTGVPWLSETPLPAGLPPLPAGFEPAPTTGRPRQLVGAGVPQH